MRKLMIVAAVASFLALGRAAASQFPVTAQAGPWMILVQSYSGENSGPLANEFAATLRRDYSLPAYVFDRGAEERAKERARIDALRKQQRERAKALGAGDDSPLPRLHSVRIEDSHAVLIGGWKDMDTARKALDSVRKLKPPPQKFMYQGVVIPPALKKTDDRQAIIGGYNPFQTAFVVHNPAVPMTTDREPEKLENLREYNADESLSLLKCRKPYTLMVKPYQGAVILASARDEKSSFLDRLTGPKSGQWLTASGKQAHELAVALKKVRDLHNRPLIAADIYVLHTEFGSYICVGGFDHPDDRELLDYQTKLAGLNLGVEKLSPHPMPMPVPKP